MTHNIKISVTVPAYKAQFLAECIDSILTQTYKNFELIIVNDASPQDLDSIVSKYNDPRIRYYKNKVGFGAEHVVGNWNKCLEYATGDYIICMGDDDKLLPSCLEEYVKLIEKYPGLGVYHGWTEIIDENSELINILQPLPEKESVYSLIYSRLSGRTQFIGDFLFDVALLRKEGGFYDLPYAWGSDNISVFRAAEKDGIAHTQVPIFQYRSNSQSISSSSHNREKMSTVYLQFKMIKNFLDKASIDHSLLSDTFRKQTLKQLEEFFLGQIKYYMLIDMKSNNRITSLLYWHKKRKVYNHPERLIWNNLIKSMI